MDTYVLGTERREGPEKMISSFVKREREDVLKEGML
jgi:hypothetical protein